METYLVTGGCGFIGSHLVDHLIRDGHQVRVLDDLSSGSLDNLHSQAIFCRGDIRDAAFVSQLLTPEVSGCFHLAAIASVEKSKKEWAKTHSINSGGTITLFEHASRLKIPVVYASSAAVYGQVPEDPVSEKSLPSPLTPYGLDKYANELHGRLASRLYDLETVGLRFFNVYGPRQSPTSPYSGVISIFTHKLSHNQPLTLYGSGKQVRDFIYVEDVILALKAGMTGLLKKQSLSKVYNVCTGHPHSLLDLIDCLEQLLKTKATLTHEAQREGDIQYSLGDPTALRSDLRISAKTSLKEGLRQLLNSYDLSLRQAYHVS